MTQNKPAAETPKKYDTASIKKLGKSQVEITASIPSSVWESFRKQAIKNLNEVVTVDGFRKGNIPENILVAKVGDMAILEEMAELALPGAYVDILVDNKIDAIGKPSITVTKLAKGNPLEFKAETSVMPEIKLPDYKNLAAKEVAKAKKEEIKIDDKDIETAIQKIRKMHAPKDKPEELPELNDEFVKKLGDFKDLPDFKVKLSEMLLEDKSRSKHEKTRIAIADAIIDKTEVELPEVLVESELERTEAQFKADLERMSVKMDDYLKHAKKTIEEVRKEWTPHAEKKAKIQLVLNEIARIEKIKPEEKDIQEQIDHIVEHYKDADREKAYIYSETVLTNEKVFEFLENQA